MFFVVSLVDLIMDIIMGVSCRSAAKGATNLGDDGCVEVGEEEVLVAW